MKAILKQQASFDASSSHMFEFVVNSTITKNRLVIYNNGTNAIVYNTTQTTSKYKHEVAANSLSNGVTYKAVIYVTLPDGIETDASEGIIFTCYSSPSFSFTTPTVNQVVGYSALECELAYVQPQNELLNSFEVFVYDDNKTLLYSSGVIYAAKSMSYKIENLEDKNIYYVKSVGLTVNGINVETDFVKISVSYDKPYLYPLFEAANDYKNGVVKIKSLIFATVGETINTPVFIDGAKIDLQNDIAKYIGGYSIPKNTDFSVVIEGYRLTPNSKIFTLIDEFNKKITLEYMIGKFTQFTTQKAYVEMKVYNSISHFVRLSNFIDVPASNNCIRIFVKREDERYDIKVEVI